MQLSAKDAWKRILDEAHRELPDHTIRTWLEPTEAIALDEGRLIIGAPDQLLSSTVAHLQEAYAVDVIGAIVVAQEAAPAMKAAGFGTIIFTGGGFADHPVPALATVSLGKAALRSAATMLGVDLGPDGIRVATFTIAGQIAAGTAFDPARIAERYWEIVQMDDPWQAEFRFTGE